MTLCKPRPDVVREIWRMLVASKKMVSANPPIAFGDGSNRKALEWIIDYSIERKIPSRRLEADQLFDDLTRSLSAT